MLSDVQGVVVKDGPTLCTGYNGAPTGFPHCHGTGWLGEQLHIPFGDCQGACRGVHAEHNAIIGGDFTVSRLLVLTSTLHSSQV